MILVTGGMGFLGLHTAKALLDTGQSVLLTRHRATLEPDFLAAEMGKRVHVVKVDVCDAHAVDSLFESHEIDGVVHLAVPPRAGMGPAQEMTAAANMFLPVISAAIHVGVARIVMGSSLAVYIGNDGDTWHEGDAVSLQSVHPIAAIKRSEEAIASFLTHATDTTIVRARITNIWGPLYRTMLNVPSRIALLAAGREEQLRDLPDPRNAHPDDLLDLMHASDCAAALAQLQCADLLEHDVYNVATGELVRYGDLVDAANAAGARPAIELRALERTPARAPRLATERLQALGFRPQVTIARGIADYVDWLRHHDT
jgi:UDP-glucose 4-epimerase